VSGRLEPPTVQRSGVAICRSVREHDGVLKGMVVVMIDSESLEGMIGGEYGRRYGFILVDHKGEVVLVNSRSGMGSWELRDLPDR
jgi:hypothetical protein